MSPQSSDTQYRQVIGDDGIIRYEPVNPPTPPPTDKKDDGEGDPYTKFGGGFAQSDRHSDLDEEQLREIGKRIHNVDFGIDEKLGDTLVNLLENSKRLRYDRRLDAGKLDSRRLTAYKTSERLFKKKAIKDKHYQFTFLIDTSGSMMRSEDEDDDDSKTSIQVACESVVRTAKALDNLKIKSSIWSMNQSVRLLKGFDSTLDETAFLQQIFRAMVEKYEHNGSDIDCAGGTSEWIAYEQAVKYIRTHSDPKMTNVVIIISDGEPGGADWTQVILEDEEPQYLENKGDKDRCSTLATFWNRNGDILAFGLGIFQKAKQVPTNRQINKIEELPRVMGNLLTELMI